MRVEERLREMSSRSRLLKESRKGTRERLVVAVLALIAG